MLARLGLILAAAVMFARPGGAQEAAVAAPPVTISQTPAVALAQDGDTFARLAGIPAEEGERQLRLADASVPITDGLRATFGNRLAGISVEHAPSFRIAVLLTGDEPVADETILANGEPIPIVFRTGARASLAELRAALAGQQAAIRAALAHPPGMGIDQRTGELVIVVARTDIDAEGRDVLTARLGALAGVPVRLRTIDGPSLDQMAGAEGGARLVGSVPGDPRHYLCTAGYAVTDGLRTGIATAAHCPDELSYVDAAGQYHPLAFVGQWGWGYQDVQINTSDKPLAPLFYADTGKTLSRPVTAERRAASTRAGDIVCHRGERTGYSCAAVELTDFAPAGDLCGGACSPTWITASGPSCGGGDSGAPVFLGTTALGLVKGGSYRGDGSCSFFFYMPIDYLPTGWRLLTQADETPLPTPPVTADTTKPVPSFPVNGVTPDTGRDPASVAPHASR